MSFADSYLQKNRGKYLFQPVDLLPMDMVVVIPCYNEPDIEPVIDTLFRCASPGISAGIVVVVNSPEDEVPSVVAQNETTIRELSQWMLHAPRGLTLHVVYAPDLPRKHAGAGWARKIGMDWAIGHFNQYDRPEGILVSLDADCRVEENYLKEIHRAFDKRPDRVGATLYFEHPLDEGMAGEAMAAYELYLRYYRHALRLSGFPHAHYSLGSCFAVRAGAYVAQGGMNRRKAGEDFYFLQKLLPYGDLGEINTTCVFPSSRISERVPFGTGPILKRILQGDPACRVTFPFHAFRVLSPFFQNVQKMYAAGETRKLHQLSSNRIFQSFCRSQGILSDLIDLYRNCASFSVYSTRFFHVFNAFVVLKWLNFATQNGFPKKDLAGESLLLLKAMGEDTRRMESDFRSLLKYFRQIDKNQEGC
ncbi:MAG TPA: glycosyltransferase [Prolixibacteraceae bacterium]|nr:glycosyltransferase [Prolixibacteraceae bacterium]